MAKNMTISLPRAHGKVSGDALRRALRRLGIRWPGDGDYSYGTEVYMVQKRQVIKLIARLPDPGHYQTEGGATYIERKTALGWVQELRGQEKKVQALTLAAQVSTAIAAFVAKRGQAPNVLHVSYDDLVKLGQERIEIADQGDAWGMTISLVPKGEKPSVDRRIEL